MVEVVLELALAVFFGVFVFMVLTGVLLAVIMGLMTLLVAGLRGLWWLINAPFREPGRHRAG